MRFWFDDDDEARRAPAGAHGHAARARRCRRSPRSLALALAGPLSRAAAGHERRDAVPAASWACGRSRTSRSPTRCCAWRSAAARTSRASLANVLLTVALTVTLVVVLDGGARGYVLGNYAASTAVLLGLWLGPLRGLVGLPGRQRCACCPGALLRFGAPTVPADATVFALNVVDRAYLLRVESPAAAGVYAVSVKLATVVIVAVRGFQAAWPPLAYSVTDEAQAKRLYATRHDVLRARHGARRRRAHAARPLDRRPARGRRLRRGLRGAALGRPGLGAVRAVPGLRDHRGPRAGHDAHVPRGCRRARRQRRGARRARRAAGDRRRRDRPVRGVPGHARRRAPAHAPPVRCALRARPARRCSSRVIGGIAVAGRAAAPDRRRSPASSGWLALAAIPLLLLAAGFLRPEERRAACASWPRYSRRPRL